MDIRSIKIQAEGEINATFTLTTADGTTHDYWSCDQGFPEACNEDDEELLPDVAGVLQTLWGMMKISPPPVCDGIKEENWKIDYSEWKVINNKAVLVREWSEVA